MATISRSGRFGIAIRAIVGDDESLVDRIFEIVKAQREY